MTTSNSPSINKPYIIVVMALTIFFPAISVLVEWFMHHPALDITLIGKWFIFYAVGFRLFVAGIRQITNPAFTMKQIFHIESEAAYPVMRELGFANVCFGIIGIISLFLPQWRIVSAFGSGLYYGLAGLMHIIKKPAGANERFAMVTDVVIFLVLLAYVLVCF